MTLGASGFGTVTPVGGIPAGTYQLFVAVVRQGALQDIGPYDILALDLRPVTMVP